MKTFILIVCASVSLVSCKTDDDLGEYFKSNFSDVVNEVLSMDSVHVVLTQTGTPSQIPFQIEDHASLGDTIRLVVSGETGSYRQPLIPQKGVSIHSDTLSIWYSHYQLPLSRINSDKNGSMSSVAGAASPLPTYVRVLNVTVRKAPNKTVTFISRMYQ